ncbi:MAG: hypothetical protein AAB568_00080, partial [Patescibacteria group bacterium]
KVSPQTIARVNAWLGQSGVGYRLVIERSKDVTVPAYKGVEMTSDWAKIKRRYPMYFWPQLLLEDIVRGANNHQRQKLLNTLRVLKKSGQKNKLFNQLTTAIKTSQRSGLKNHKWKKL